MQPISTQEFPGSYYSATLAFEREDYAWLRVSPCFTSTDLLLNCEMNNGFITAAHYATTKSASLFCIDIKPKQGDLEDVTLELTAYVTTMIAVLNNIEQGEWNVV